jgi:hypothetical protein
MKKFTHMALAAAVAVGGFAFSTNVRADDNTTTTGEKVDRSIDKAGDATGRAVDRTKQAAKDVKSNWDHGRINTMLAQVTNASLTKGGFDDLIERFNDADRNRLSTFFKDKNNSEKLTVLDGRIAQFQKDWKAKYGQDFHIMKDDVVFGSSMFTITRGEIGTDAQLAGKSLPPGDKVTAGDAKRAAEDSTGNTKLDRNIEKGRNVAMVTVAKSHGLPELQVPLIHELPDLWKIDVPDNINGQKLYDNLLKHLTMANEQKDQWPSDVNDAYRSVAHHVLMAVLDVHEKAGRAGANIGSDTTRTVEK